MTRLFSLGLLALTVSAMVATVRLARADPNTPVPGQAQQQALIDELLDAIGPFPPSAKGWHEALASADRVTGGAEWASAAFAPSDIVLQPSDVGPDFLVASGGEQLRFGVSWRTQNLVRAGKNSTFIEPDGLIFVRSFVLQADDPSAADQAFNQAGARLFEGVQERPVSAIGERTRAGVVWADGPFGIAAKLILFRVRTIAAGVIVAGFEAPTGLDDITPLARLMATRASRA